MSTLSAVRRERRDELTSHAAVMAQMLKRSGAVRTGKHALGSVDLTTTQIPKRLAPRRNGEGD